MKSAQPFRIRRGMYNLRVTKRMSVTQYVLPQEFGMILNQAFWVQTSTHIIHVSFLCTFYASEIYPPEGVQFPEGLLKIVRKTRCRYEFSNRTRIVVQGRFILQTAKVCVKWKIMGEREVCRKDAPTLYIHRDFGTSHHVDGVCEQFHHCLVYLLEQLW